MEININPEEIDKFVKDKILESTIGKSVKESIDKTIKDLFSGYRNPVEQIIKDTIGNFVKDYLKDESVRPKILEAIAKGLAPETIELIVSNAAHDLQKRIKDRND